MDAYPQATIGLDRSKALEDDKPISFKMNLFCLQNQQLTEAPLDSRVQNSPHRHLKTVALLADDVLFWHFNIGK